MNNKKDNSQNRSMFLYTALIFAVALILIILAFFGQTNLSNLRRNAENAISETEQNGYIQTQPPETTTAGSDEMAKIANSISALDAENKDLKKQLSVYDSLAEANKYISDGDIQNAASVIETIDNCTLTDNQIILYNQILNKIDEGKEQ